MNQTERRASVPGTIWVPRLAAIAGGSGVAVHLWAALNPMHGLVMTLVMAVMAAACLPCVIATWRRHSGMATASLMGMSVAMVLVHIALLALQSRGAHTEDAAHMSAMTDVIPGHDVVRMTITIVVIEFLAAGLCALALRCIAVNRWATVRDASKAGPRA